MKYYLSITDFNSRIKECKNKKILQKLNAMFLYRIHKKSAKGVAALVHTSIGNIYQWAYKYNKYGGAWFNSKPRGGRKKACLTIKQEEAVLEKVTEDSRKGLIVVARNVQLIAENEAGKSLYKNYAYSLLKRHKWRKIKPRPKNPKSSQQVQEEFKQNFSKSVEEVIKTFDNQDNRPVKVLAEDEARFGRMSRPKRCWAPKGIRPIVPAQLVRQFLYVFTVVCPITGSNFSIIFSDADTVMMNLFLAEVSLHYKDYRLVILVDQAAWHKSQGLKTFDNIRFLLLPPGSPELNPVEHIWDEVREKRFANRNFDSLDEVKDVLVHEFKEMYLNPSLIQSIVGFPWMKLDFIH